MSVCGKNDFVVKWRKWARIVIEWDIVSTEGLAEMCTSIREDLGGIGVGLHRENLTKRLGHVLGQLDRGLGHLKQHNPALREDHIRTTELQYRELKEVLLEVDRGALEILTRTPFKFISPLIYSPQWIPTESHSTFTGGRGGLTWQVH